MAPEHFCRVAKGVQKDILFETEGRVIKNQAKWICDDPRLYLTYLTQLGITILQPPTLCVLILSVIDRI